MKRSKRLISTTALLLSAVILFTDSASLYGEPLSPKAAEKEYAIGSDEVAYNAGYISKKAFDSLEEEAKDAYIFACDEIADMYSAGIGLSDVYLATDKDGNVYVRYSVPAVTLAGEVNEFSEAVIADISENGLPEDISLNDIEIPEEEPASEEPETEETDAPVEEETFTGFISENLEFFDDTGLEEEEVSFDEDEDELSFEANDYDSLLSYYNENHFKFFNNTATTEIYTSSLSNIKVESVLKVTYKESICSLIQIVTTCISTNISTCQSLKELLLFSSINVSLVVVCSITITFTIKTVKLQTIATSRKSYCLI